MIAVLSPALFWNVCFQSSCMFWMPAQALNFFFVPSSLRVVYIGSCSFMWCNILCMKKRGNDATTSDDADKKDWKICLWFYSRYCMYNFTLINGFLYYTTSVVYVLKIMPSRNMQCGIANCRFEGSHVSKRLKQEVDQQNLSLNFNLPISWENCPNI